MAYEVDADGERKIIRVAGWDRSNPESIYEGWTEVRPGGMMVFHATDTRPVTVSAPAPTPTAEQIAEERDARQNEYVEKEKAAREQEAAADEIKKNEIAAKKAARKAALEAEAGQPTPAA